MKKAMRKAAPALLCLLALLLTACQTGGTTPEATPRPTPAPTAEPTAEPTAGPATESGLYEQFLAGTGLVYDDRFQIRKGNWEEAELLVPEGQGYTLSELAQAVVAPDYEAERSRKLNEVLYAYLDCGSDGVPELALEVRCTDEWEDMTYNQVVIKELDGKLQLCWLGETYYRSYEALADASGKITSYGSSGYASSYSSVGAIDGDGVYHLLYSIDDEYGFAVMYPDFNPVSAAAAAYEDELPIDYLLEIVTVYDTETGEGTVYYGADPEDDELVQTIFNEAGAVLTPASELKQLCAAPLTAMGLTESGDELIFNSVDYEASGLDTVLRYGQNPVFVSTVEEFADAIGPNRTLVLASGTYNVTEWLNANADRLVPYYSEDYADANDPGVHYGGGAGEYEFIISGLYGLRIVSEDTEAPAVIVSEPRYYNVIALHDCSYVEIENVVMGHTVEQGFCSGDVLAINNSYSVYVTDCDLYGCGAYGLYADSSSNIQLQSCVIHDCSYGCIQLYSNSNVVFDDCTFRDCQEYDMFNIMDSSADFIGCEFSNLQGNMLWMSDDSYAFFSGCSYDKASLDSLYGYSGKGHLTIND